MEYLTIHVHLYKSCTEILTPKGDGIRRWGLWEEVGTLRSGNLNGAAERPRRPGTEGTPRGARGPDEDPGAPTLAPGSRTPSLQNCKELLLFISCPVCHVWLRHPKRTKITEPSRNWQLGGNAPQNLERGVRLLSRGSTLRPSHRQLERQKVIKPYLRRTCSAAGNSHFNKTDRF